MFKALPDRCEEASPLSGATYIPCNAPAVRMIKTRDPQPYRMCEACADHNVRNRGAEDVGAYPAERRMPVPRQYVACKFRPEDSRSYTYHNDGEPVAPGDVVKVEDRSGDGWKRVHVVSISDQAPSFATKPILGKVDAEPTGDALFPDGAAEQ